MGWRLSGVSCLINRVSWSFFRRYHWIGFGAVCLLVLGLGFDGFREVLVRESSVDGTPLIAPGVGDLLYATLQLFTLESGAVDLPTPVTLGIARWLAPILAGYATARALLAIFRAQAQQLHMRFFRDHVVICDTRQEGRMLAAAFETAGSRVVLIERGSEPVESGSLSFRVPVIRGDARDLDVLRRARVPRARLLVAASADSGYNAEVAVAARALDPGRTWPALTCVAQIRELELCRLLREREFSRVRSAGFRLEFANLAEIGARALFSAYPPSVPSADAFQHLLIVGSGELCQSLVLLAIQRANSKTSVAGRLRITLIDARASEMIELVRERWPGLDRACDLCVRPVKPNPGAFSEVLSLRENADVPPVTHSYVCLGEDPGSITAALVLQRVAHQTNSTFPIIVAVDDRDGLARLVAGHGGGRAGSSIECFALRSAISDPAIVEYGITETLARSVHERYTQNRLAAGESLSMNPSLLSWSELPDALKESNRSQAEGIVASLEECGYWVAPRSDWSLEPSPLPEEYLDELARREHVRWATDLRQQGWEYGPGDKDPDRRTSPDLVDWPELDDATRQKDFEAVREWPALLASVGLQIERTRNRD